MKCRTAVIFALLAVLVVTWSSASALAQSQKTAPGVISSWPIRTVAPAPSPFLSNGVWDPPEYRASGVYSWGPEFNTPTATSTVIDTLYNNNFNIVIPEIRKAGDAYYNSAYEPWATDVQAGYDPLADMITKAHAKGLTPEGKWQMEVHGWIVTYRIWPTSTSRKAPSTHIWAKHPEWAMVKNNGSIQDGPYYDLDPGVPGVQQYITDLMKDCISKYPGLDGYNFDYIRYPTWEWGHNPISKKRFKREYGYDPPTFWSPGYEPFDNWCEWRRQQVTDLVKKCYLEAIYLNPRIKMSVFSIPWMGGDPNVDFTGTRAYSELGQDHNGWMMDHIIDVNFLMNYKRDWTRLLAPSYWYKNEPYGNQQADHRIWSDYLTNVQGWSGRHAVDFIGGYMNIMQGVLDQWEYSRSRYTFDPESRTYSALDSDLPAEDYTATLQTNTTTSGHVQDSAKTTIKNAAVATSGGSRPATTGQDGRSVPAGVAQVARGLAAPKTGFTASTDSNQRAEAGDTLPGGSVLGSTSAAVTPPAVGSANTVTFGKTGSGLPRDTSGKTELGLPAGTRPTGLPAPDKITDVGDFYLAADGARISLQRATNEAAVRYAAQVSPTQGLAQLQSTPGIPAMERVSQVTYHTRSPIDVLRMRAGSGGLDASAIARQASVAFAYPVLVDPASRCRMIPTDEVLARFPNGVSAHAQQSAISAAGLQIVEQTGNQSLNVFLLRLVNPKVGNALDAANALAGSGKVVWAQPNFLRETRHFSTPSDPLYSFQQNMHNTGQNGAVSDSDVDAPEAWNSTTGSSSVTIAIIDDGVDTSHADLNIASGGYDFANGDSNPNPVGMNGHGTGCAGIAAAIINNGYRTAGIAGSCKILPIKIFDDSGYWVSVQAAGEAISYAAEHADILSNSWGGGSSSSYIDDAVDYANTSGRGGKGCPVFFATGNSASKWGGRYRIPMPGLPSGNYYLGFCYKQGSDWSDENAVMIDDVSLLDSDGYTHKTSVLPSQGFEGGSVLPSGWSFSNNYGTAQWYRTSTNAKSGTGGSYSVRSPSMSSGQYSTELLTPLLSLAGNETFCFDFYGAAGNNSYLYVILYDAGKNYVGYWGFWCDTPYVPDGIAYPSSLSQTYSGTCAVGASTDCDRRSDYSQYGSGLDFLAPSNGGWNDIVTLDPTGNVGWTDTDYKTNFGGTSSACPLAAGVAALVLSQHPNLTAGGVRTTLRNSCDKIGPYTYYGGWNQYYGYGRINAASAVGASPSLKISGFVLTPELEGVPGVTINGLPSAPITGADGYYECEVTAGWSGTVTPSKDWYTFIPPSRDYEDVVSSQSNQDYTAIMQTYTISGYVLTAGGAPIADVKMDGLPGNPTPRTDTAGYYSVTVPFDWEGTVTPTRWHDAGLGMYRYGFGVGLEDPYAPGLPVLVGRVVVQGSETMFYDTVKSTMFQNPAPIPDMPWKSNPTEGYLFGQVTHALEPNDSTYQNWIYKATVTAVGPLGTPEEAEWEEQTDATGTYGFMHLPPGNYKVTFTTDGCEIEADIPATVVKGQATKLSLQLGPLILPENHKPIGDVLDPVKTPDDTIISLTGDVVVTSPTGAISGCVYVETEDRSSGLQVRLGSTQPAVAEGDRVVDLIGMMSTVNGERVLTPAAVMGQTSWEKPLAVLGSTIRDMSRLPISTGLLMRICGKVVVADAGAGWFEIADGSGTMRVNCPGLIAPSKGLAVQVTGTNGIDATGRVLRVRGPNDISIVTKSTVSSPTMPTETISTGLNLISLPYVPMDPTTATVLSGVSINGSLYRWDNTTQAFVSYDQTQPTVFGNTCPSEGYALFSTAAKTISFEGLPNPVVDTRIALPTHGWSLIGFPFLSPVVWGDVDENRNKVMVTDGASTLPLLKAVTAKWIARIAFTWDTSSGSFGYVGTGARGGARFGDSLCPWKAYWIATYKDNLALIIKPGG